VNGEDRVNADAPVGAFDEELLSLLRTCYETLDPMSPTLVGRTLHTLALDSHRFEIDAIEADMVRLAEQRDLEPLGARGEDTSVITFESDELTVMIRISRQGEAVCLDGWLAPPGPDQVSLRTEHGAVDAAVDEEGRFVLDTTVRGPVQLVVLHRAPQTAGWTETVLVPAIVL
jgi:hypothetical protein